MNVRNGWPHSRILVLAKRMTLDAGALTFGDLDDLLEDDWLNASVDVRN